MQMNVNSLNLNFLRSINLLLIKYFYPTIAALSLIGCAGKKELSVQPLDQTFGLRPGEIRLIETLGDKTFKELYGPDIFVGISNECPDEASAQDNAELHTRRQIVNSLEMDVSIEVVDRYLKRADLTIDQTGLKENIYESYIQNAKTKVVANNILRVKSEGFYIEKWMRGKISGIEYFYKAWCLIKYSKEDHNRMVTEVVNEMLLQAEPLFNYGKDCINQGKIRDALRQLQRVKDICKEIEGYRGISVDLTESVRDLKTRNEDLMANLTILVAVKETIFNKTASSSVVEAKLAEILSTSSDFAVKSSIDLRTINLSDILDNRSLQIEIAKRESADFLLIGEAKVNNSSKVNTNIYVAKCEMRLKLIEGTSGIVIWETTIPGRLISDNRGFANNPQSAGLNAISLNQIEDPFQKIIESILESLE